jgi:hypothetical protein
MSSVGVDEGLLDIKDILKPPRWQAITTGRKISVKAQPKLVC